MTEIEITKTYQMEGYTPEWSAVQSPFLPGTSIQYAWDSTSLGYLKTCPRLYQYIMIEGYQSPDESIHLRFGIEYHKALEDFDRYTVEGIERGEAIRRVVHELLCRTVDFNPSDETKAGKYKNRSALVRTVIDYLDHYATDEAKVFVKADGAPAVELSFRFELDWGPNGAYIDKGPDILGETYKGEPITTYVTQPYLLCGHLDRVVTFSDDLFVMDRKTTTSTPGSYYFDQYDPNNQMTLYTLASQVILNTPVKGVIIDAAQILIGSSRFVRGITYRTADHLEEWLVDLRHWLRRAEEYATEGYWPMNDTACDKFGGCRFRSICSKAPGIREQFLKNKFVQLPEEEKWNPLRPR